MEFCYCSQCNEFVGFDLPEGCLCVTCWEYIWAEQDVEDDDT